jgi:hypothetical protein
VPDAAEDDRLHVIGGEFHRVPNRATGALPLRPWPLTRSQGLLGYGRSEEADVTPIPFCTWAA